jgi:hypothetical protein
MPILPRVPWVSLILLILSYTALGWVISEAKASRIVWLLTVIAILLLMLSLTIPWTKIRKASLILFKSSTRTFFFAVFAAFVFFVILAWFRLFLDSLLIISAAILARIDTQAAGLNQWQAFWLISSLSFLGLALGVSMQILLSQ